MAIHHSIFHRSCFLNPADIAGDEFYSRILIARPAFIIDRNPAGKVDGLFIGVEDGRIVGLPADLLGGIGYLAKLRAGLFGIGKPDERRFCDKVGGHFSQAKWLRYCPAR